MRYRFNGFEFDSTSLLLTKNNETIAIRHTQVKVLAILLDTADKVISKEELLSHVWQSKVVSEQVVFQNISQLRSLFGNHAIKTFPKLGYQWQLNTEVISPEPQCSPQEQSSQSIQAPLQAPDLIPAKKRPFWLLAVTASLIFIAMAMLYSQNLFNQESTDSRIKLAYVAITNLEDKSSSKYQSITLEDNSDVDFSRLSHLDTGQFEDSMEIEYPKLSKDHPFILTGSIRSYKQQSYLDFKVKGPVSDWQGQVSGASQKELIEQLQQHLKQQVIYDLIGKQQTPGLRQAKLSIAHQGAPDDLIILRRLSISYLKSNELDKAMAMADKLINLARAQNKPQHIARALLYQSNLLEQKKLYDLSSQKLQLAIEQFEKINDLKHLAKAWYIQSWLDHQKHNYPAVKASLLKSAQLAYHAKDKRREINALTYLALKAHHYQHSDDKYLYLSQAENKMKTYRLADYHFAKIPFYYATFAKTPSEREPYLKQALKFSALAPDHWIAQSARKQLMRHYIRQNRLDESRALIAGLTRENANNSYLKTLVAQASQQKDKMLSYAQRTFEQAQLAGDLSLSLEVALLLYEQGVNRDFYAQYIDNNASASWQTSNKAKLLKLDLPAKTADTASL